MTMEKRGLAVVPEFRADADGMRVSGYAAVFNQETEIAGEFREVIAPGAFSKSISQDIRALVEHDPRWLIGRTSAGTLRLKEDAHGLAVEIDLPDTTAGRDLRVSLERGDITGMSFGFRVPRGGDDWDHSSVPPLRTVRSLQLIEVSAVSAPAYDGTELALRSKSESLKELRTHNFNGMGKRFAMKTAVILRKAAHTRRDRSKAKADRASAQ